LVTVEEIIDRHGQTWYTELATTDTIRKELPGMCNYNITEFF